MKVQWQFYALCVAVALLPGSLVAADAKDVPAPSLESLQKAPRIRCVIDDGRDGSSREVTLTDPRQLERVRAWIQKYAWPPIDIRATGAVAMRGHFDIFERVGAPKPAFTIHVFGITTRAEPAVTHVTDENWEKFLALIPPRATKPR